MEFSYTLDESWLAGMLGALTMKEGGKSYFVTLDIEDPLDMHVVRRPGRKRDDTKISKKIRAALINRAQELLKSGVTMTSVPKSLPLFRGARVYLRKDSDGRYYTVKYKDGTTCRWDDARRIETRAPVLERVERSFNTALLYSGNGVEEGAGESVHAYLDKMTSEELHRVVIYLTGVSSSITLLRLSKSGKGQDFTPSTYDDAVERLLNELTLLCPTAIQRSTTSPTNTFLVKNGALFLSLRAIILEKASQTERTGTVWDLSERTGREIYYYQQKSAERLLKSQKRGGLVWGPTGIGKTLIVTTFIRGLIADGRMPRYCFYLLPKSALASVSEEFRMEGLPWVHRSMVKAAIGSRVKNGDVELPERTVIFIEHDHVWRGGLPERMTGLLGDSLVVVDEFHKAMAGTKRTTHVINAIRISKHFVGLSATVVHGTDIRPVYKWLEPIVDFEITEANFWTAATAMVSLRAKVEVAVTREEKEAFFTRNEKKEYLALLRGDVGARDFNKAVTLCYAAVTRSMVLDITTLLAEKRGIFSIVKNLATARDMAERMGSVLAPEEIHIITSNTPINLPRDSESPVRLLITTKQNREGYNATKMDAVVQCVIYTNQSVRDQLDGRTVRIGQDSNVLIRTHYAGLLKDAWVRYQRAGSFASALKGIAEEVGVPREQMRHIQ